MPTPTENNQEKVVLVSAAEVTLQGNLDIPKSTQGIVLFAHGSGSSRFSPRNRFVAGFLRQAGLATLLIDLLTAEEEQIDLRTRQLRFDIGLLTERLIGASDWLSRQEQTKHLAIGCFGASTGAAAALLAASLRPELVRAVVSRGGRPDLAGDNLGKVRAPTLLIVGGNDLQVLTLNRQALAQLNCEKKLDIIPGATHLFEEAGALTEVARLAASWFKKHLVLSEA